MLLQLGEPAAAERVFREDLERFPANGWSFYGLEASMRAQGRSGEATVTEPNSSECGRGRNRPSADELGSVEHSCHCPLRSVDHSAAGCRPGSLARTDFRSPGHYQAALLLSVRKILSPNCSELAVARFSILRTKSWKALSCDSYVPYF